MFCENLKLQGTYNGAWTLASRTADPVDTLRDTFASPIGYSGHDIGIQVSIAAAARGAAACRSEATPRSRRTPRDRRAQACCPAF